MELCNERSYDTVINNLQRKIAFEASLKEPNIAVITLYKSEITYYQKLEKKRLQKLALVAKCESVFAPLKENAQQLQTNLQNEQYTLASSMEIFVENAPDMVKGQAGTAFAQDVAMLRNLILETNGLCEAIT